MSLSLVRKRKNCDGNNQSTTSDGPNKRRHYGDSQNANISQSQGVNGKGIEDTRRCGKLLSMHLTNFMCHSNLLVEFHSRVNFLVGSNGSGKSAVLAALVLGLGGSAKTTNRSRSAKAFIKNGESTAKIEIVIANDGPQPYEPETYGDKITVIRTISLTSGSYLIKDAAGHTVSKKVDDLHRILMYHNVQVDNPVFVLNQDSAREFLKDLEPSKNYNLFLKATQIDVVLEKLNDSLHLHKTHLHELKNYETKLTKVREDIAEHEKKLEELLSFEKLKDVLNQRDTEHAWLLVTQYEEKLQEIDDKFEKYKKRENELQRLIENKDEINQQLKAEISKYNEDINEKNSNYDQENRQYREIKSKVDAIAKRSADISSSLDSLKHKKSRLEEQIQILKQHIHERSQGNQDDVDALRAKNENEIDQYRKQCETNIDPMIENIKRELKLHIDSKAQKEQVVSEIKRLQRDCSDEIRLHNANIATVKASTKNKILIYGNHMFDLINDIKKAHKQGLFSELPRGPIGSYVEVPNSEFRDVVENILGKTLLGAFLVNNKKDCDLLEKILAKYDKRRPMIITTKFAKSVYDVSNGCVTPPKGTSLLLNEIRCNDPVVINCLIDRIRIESVLITKNKEIAESITSKRENVPTNLFKVIVVKGSNLILEYHPAPKYRMYSSRLTQASLIQVNTEERLRHLENEKLALEKKLKEFDKDLNCMAQQIPQDAKLIQEKRDLLAKHESTRRELLDKIRELESFEYADIHNEMELLKKEMEENEGRLEEMDKKIDEKRIKLADANNEKSNYEDELLSKEQTLRNINAEIEDLKAKSDQIKAKLRSVNSSDATNRNKLTDIQEHNKKINHERNEISKKLGIHMEMASEKGERVETELSAEQLQEEISRIKAKLKHGKPVSLDPQSMHELINTKKEALEASQGNYDNIKGSILTLRKSLKFRFDFLKKLKEHMALLLQISFSMILKLRNFEGCLDVNHQEKTLKLSVIPRDHNKNAVSNTKSLSGGERSYSTVAFLISLWSCVDHPFYFLDEYDVFTDEVNREYMTRLLVDEGRKRPLRQYSFLTPQDMSLMSEDFIKILRLGEPDRD